MSQKNIPVSHNDIDFSFSLSLEDKPAHFPLGDLPAPALMSLSKHLSYGDQKSLWRVNRQFKGDLGKELERIEGRLKQIVTAIKELRDVSNRQKVDVLLYFSEKSSNTFLKISNGSNLRVTLSSNNKDGNVINEIGKNEYDLYSVGISCDRGKYKIAYSKDRQNEPWMIIQTNNDSVQKGFLTIDAVIEHLKEEPTDDDIETIAAKNNEFPKLKAVLEKISALNTLLSSGVPSKGGAAPVMKKTDIKKNVFGRERIIYKGKNGKQYVKMKGAFVAIVS